MSENLCPICQRPNPPNAERCWYCQAVLPPQDQAHPADEDWLNEFREESENPSQIDSENSSSTHSEEETDEIPDWLARIRSREQQERESLSDGQKPQYEDQEKEDLPEWLKEIKSGNSGKRTKLVEPAEKQSSDSIIPPKTQNQLTESSQEETQEWLDRLADWKPTESKLNASDPSQDLLAENPETVEKVKNDSIPLSQDLHTGDGEKAYDLDAKDGWQRIPPDENFQIENEGEQLISKLTTNPESEFKPSSEKPQIELPDQKGREISAENNEWMDELLSNPLFESTPPFSAEERFSEFDPSNQEKKSQNFPFDDKDLPEWLCSASSNAADNRTKAPISSEREINSNDPKRKQKNFPPDQQEIHPITANRDREMAIPDSNFEGQGMLLNLEDALQNSEIPTEFRKPIGYGSLLSISEHQKNNANLLANLIEESIEIQPIEESSKLKLKAVLLRSMLALGMLIIIFFSKDFFSNYTVRPALFAPEVVAFYDMVNALPAEKPVLLVSDFEPASAGELLWSSKTIIEHLMRRGMNIALLSNNATGSTIVSQSISTIALDIPVYDLNNQLVNLGYLPGSAIGIQLLAENPRTALPFTHDFFSAWDSTILHPIHSLADFGAVIVISDKPEGSRTWIEQIQPTLGSVPLAMVGSAQAAPMLMPYFQSKQITGFINGYYGSFTYEVLLEQPTNKLDHLTAFQSTLVFLAVLILLGGLITLMRPPTTEGKRTL